MQDIVIPGSLDLIEALKVAFCLNHAHTHTHINGINVGALYIIHIDTLLVVWYVRGFILGAMWFSKTCALQRLWGSVLGGVLWNISIMMFDYTVVVSSSFRHVCLLNPMSKDDPSWWTCSFMVSIQTTSSMSSLCHATFRRSLQRWRSPSRFPSDVSSRPSLAVQMWRKCPGRMMACSLLAVDIYLFYGKRTLSCFTLFYIGLHSMLYTFIMYNHYPWGYVQVMQSLRVIFCVFCFLIAIFFSPSFNKKSTDVPRQEVLIHGSEV